MEHTPKELLNLIFDISSIKNINKICLAIKMPDESTELIINQDAKAKIEYIERDYDDDLKLKTNNDIQIVSYMFY